MKKLLISVALTVSAFSCFAQRPYFCVKSGAVLEYTTYDANGKESGTSRTEIISASGSNGNYEISTKSESFVDGKSIMSPMEVTASVENGNVSVALAGGPSIDISGDVPFIPSRLAVGMELDCGTITVTTSGVRVSTDILSNRVVGREEIDTPAGTFKCYIVEMEQEAKVIGIKTKGSQKTWYSRGIGTVKAETYDAKGKLVQAQLLTSYSE